MHELVEFQKQTIDNTKAFSLGVLIFAFSLAAIYWILAIYILYTLIKEFNFFMNVLLMTDFMGSQLLAANLTGFLKILKSNLDDFETIK